MILIFSLVANMFSKALLILAVAGNVVKGYGQQKPLADHTKGPLNPQFDALVQETMDHLHVPGLSVAVVVGNETYAKVQCLQARISTQ